MASDSDNIDSLLKKSKGTDIPILLRAKEQAKKLVNDDPSAANLAALRTATTMLENAENAMSTENEPQRLLKNVGDVLRYLQDECHRQVAKSKLYADIKIGLLRKENKSFRQRDVDRYAATLPLSTTPDGRTAAALALQQRKDAAEVRRIEALADREEKKNAIMEGAYVSREDVNQELAARAMTLNSGIKTAVQTAALDIILAVGGDQQKTELLIRKMDEVIDGACNEYSRAMEFEVNLHALDDEGNDADESASDG